MRYIHHLIDDTKFNFVSDLEEIGHYEIIDSRSTNMDGHRRALAPEEVIRNANHKGESARKSERG